MPNSDKQPEMAAVVSPVRPDGSYEVCIRTPTHEKGRVYTFYFDEKDVQKLLISQAAAQLILQKKDDKNANE
jgi:hypothetical protein